MNSSLPGQDPQTEQLQGVGEVMEILLTGISDRIKILEFTDTLVESVFLIKSVAKPADGCGNQHR